MSINLSETVIGSTTSSESFSLSSWVPSANDLILVSIAQRDESVDVSVSGNSLTFVEIFNVDNTQGQNGVSMFRALGASPSSGQITVTVTGNSKPVVAVASRFSGCDTSGTDGSGAIESISTNPGPGSDNADMLQSITTLTNGAWAHAVGTHRSATFTTPSDQTSISINNLVGSGGDRCTCSTFYKEMLTAGAIEIGETGDLSSSTDWTLGVVSVKPSGGGGVVTSVPGKTLLGAGV